MALNNSSTCSKEARGTSPKMSLLAEKKNAFYGIKNVDNSKCQPIHKLAYGHIISSLMEIHSFGPHRFPYVTP